jgi:uncharacterized protein YsxB (DUF464 family)
MLTNLLSFLKTRDIYCISCSDNCNTSYQSKQYNYTIKYRRKIIMIIIKKMKNGTIEVSGHANSDVCGKDLVCCAVSTLIQSVSNYSYFVEITKDKAIILNTLPYKVTALRDYLISSLTDLSEQFPENINIVKEGL